MCDFLFFVSGLRVCLQTGTVAPVFKLRHMATSGGADEATSTRSRCPKRYLRKHGHPAAQPGHRRSTAHLPTRKLLHAQSPTLFFPSCNVPGIPSALLLQHEPTDEAVQLLSVCQSSLKKTKGRKRKRMSAAVSWVRRRRITVTGVRACQKALETTS
jgi:hypothetical protein